jgi:uncharacterized protein DUF1573
MLAAEKPQPKAVVPEPIHDFGTIEKTVKLSHDFEIRNEGQAPLLIREVRPECSCTVADFDKSIAPGSAGKVHIDFDPLEVVGPLKKGALVFTNDPAAPQIQLTILANVKPALLIQPGYARYIYVQQEVPGVINQTIWSVDGSPFRVLEVKSPYPYLKTAFWEAKQEERLADHPGQQWRVSTTLASDAPVGALEKMVEITTDNPKQRVLELPVSGFVRPVIAVTPPGGDLGSHKRGAPFSASLGVRNFATESIALTGVSSDIKGVLVKLEPVIEGRSYKLALAFADDIPVGKFDGKVTITTASPKMPVVEVPLSGAIE